MLPPAAHFALTWGIPENYGGMTSALLHRSRVFARLGGVAVDVLTLEDRPGTAELQERMLASGELVEGMRLRNLWEELRASPPAAATRPPEPVAGLEPAPDDRVIEREGVVLLRARTGAETAVDRFRADGSLLAAERLVDGRRRIVAVAPDGAPLRAWPSTWALYRWWLDALVAERAGEGPAVVLADSKTAARFLAGYRRAGVTTIHVVHGAHRVGGRPGTLSAAREHTLRHAADFDAVVVLTRRQRDDLVADGLAAGARIAVIPNGVDPAGGGDAERDPAQGVVLAALSERKRLTDAVTAVARARATDPRVRLDVHGEGPSEPAIRQRIAEEGVGDAVVLRGFDPGAKRRFASAGFTLLTSTSEGLPLVLVESMAAGCIPIAYDIRYGPSDVIRDGVDGFLVAEGDVEAMAERILRLQSMSPQQREAMRAAAVVRAAEFSDAAVTARWAALLAEAETAGASAPSPSTLLARLRGRAGRLRRRLRRR